MAIDEHAFPSLSMRAFVGLIEVLGPTVGANVGVNIGREEISGKTFENKINFRQDRDVCLSAKGMSLTSQFI